MYKPVTPQNGCLQDVRKINDMTKEKINFFRHQENL